MKQILKAVHCVLSEPMEDKSGGWGKLHGWPDELWQKSFSEHAPEYFALVNVFKLSEQWSNDLVWWYNDHCEKYGLGRLEEIK